MDKAKYPIVKANVPFFGHVSFLRQNIFWNFSNCNGIPYTLVEIEWITVVEKPYW
jgi:hypothetical protein